MKEEDITEYLKAEEAASRLHEKIVNRIGAVLDVIAQALGVEDKWNSASWWFDGAAAFMDEFNIDNCYNGERDG